MAARLGAYFGVPARWWLLLQAEYDAADVAGRPELVLGVTPMPPDPDVMLTPTGVIRLDQPVAEAPVPSARGVRIVRYENGAIGLSSEDA